MRVRVPPRAPLIQKDKRQHKGFLMPFNRFLPANVDHCLTLD